MGWVGEEEVLWVGGQGSVEVVVARGKGSVQGVVLGSERGLVERRGRLILQG